ncbi:DUF6689 family protein [Aliikangiella sp. IMCC44653]
MNGKYKFSSLLILLYLLVLAPSQVNAQSVVVDVKGNKARIDIELANVFHADLTLSFENSVGLTAQSLGVSAEVVDITDLSLISRLPNGMLNSIPVGFPVLITIEPLSDKGLSFAGLVTLDIHTHNLEYTANTPLRLFKAPLNGEFRDITMTTGSGSYRARGTTGKFSQFMIVADTRAPVSVINTKYSAMQSVLSQHADLIENSVYATLSLQLNQLGSDIASQNYQLANQRLNQFKQTVEQASADQIPNVWRSSRDIENVAGELVARANTLGYSLRLIN